MIYQVKQREAELRGETRGRQEGRLEGRQEGRQEGKEQQAKETAYRLQKRGMSPNDIAAMVNVSIATVQDWLAEPQRTPAK